MNTRTQTFKWLFVASLNLGLACSESSFTSTSGKNTSDNSNNSRSQSDEPDGKTDSDEDIGNRRPGGLDGDDPGSTVDQAAGEEGLAAITFDDCLRSKADNYNILLIFDNSGSQNTTDPDAVRREGALFFVDQFADYVQRNPQAIARFGVFSFNQGSRQISKQWLQVGDTQIDQIKADILTATSNPSGGTAYSPVLKEAANFYGQLNDGDRKIKNFTVFLTDGLPNAAGLDGLIGGGISPVPVERLSDIPVAVDALVNNYNVAMIAIAAGQGIPVEGESTTKNLARPTVGTKDSKHIGIYRRARTPEELKEVWKGLFATIGRCD